MKHRPFSLSRAGRQVWRGQRAERSGRGAVAALHRPAAGSAGMGLFFAKTGVFWQIGAFFRAGVFGFSIPRQFFLIPKTRFWISWQRNGFSWLKNRISWQRHGISWQRAARRRQVLAQLGSGMAFLGSASRTAAKKRRALAAGAPATTRNRFPWQRNAAGCQEIVFLGGGTRQLGGGSSAAAKLGEKQAKVWNFWTGFSQDLDEGRRFLSEVWKSRPENFQALEAHARGWAWS